MVPSSIRSQAKVSKFQISNRATGIAAKSAVESALAYVVGIIRDISVSSLVTVLISKQYRTKVPSPSVDDK
jgi:hypothetical protein